MTVTMLEEGVGAPPTLQGAMSVSPKELSSLEETKLETNNVSFEDETLYRALVVDSGPIIKLTGLSALRNKAKEYFTVPAVVQEIRDAKAREHMEQLPFELVVRDASAEGIQAAVAFSRQTGDYQSLSSVDLQVLGLLYDLEKEGCGIEHIRTKPKHMVGVGRMVSLGNGQQTSTVKIDKQAEQKSQKPEKSTQVSAESGRDFFSGSVKPIDDSVEKEEAQPTALNTTMKSSAPCTWAALVNPTEGSKTLPQVDRAQIQIKRRLQKLQISNETGVVEGQFSDAEESGAELDAPENAYQEELESEFPSLAASLHVPYEGSDEENDQEEVVVLSAAQRAKKEAEKKALESLKPVSKSGKHYNSFKNYSEVMQPKALNASNKETVALKSDEQETAPTEEKIAFEEALTTQQVNVHSRIIGGTSMSGQGDEVDDDGEGWITCTKDIRKMKAAGMLNPTASPDTVDSQQNKDAMKGPPIHQRSACATTDFAMQNVILQMNLELLSVDGMKVRKLKSWVSRCGACFKVYTGEDSNGPYAAKRLFCSHCGSDMIQRIAASVDGKTGRIRLHLSKKYKTSTRGTKFSLPKAGTNNRFQGDLLLREDQLLMGAWNQKVKKLSGGRSRNAAESMFGSDLATTLGCHAKQVHQDDIKVGFGRRNPNASKGGRERRGKKKKSGEKSCGLRRY